MLLILLFALTLVNSRRMPSPSLAAYFLYIFSIAAIAIGTGMSMIFSSRPLSLQRSPALFLFAGWGIYVFARGRWADGVLHTHAVYIFVTAFLFCCIIFMQHLVMPSVKVVLSGVIVLACLESLVIFLQLAGILPVVNDNFRITGTWVNPNVTAMFLAMSLPAVLYLLIGGGASVQGEDRHRGWPAPRRFALAALLMIVTALCLLRCRTAIAGALAAAVIIVAYRWRWLQWLRRRRQFGVKLFLLGFALVALWAGGVAAYRMKQASADGRKLIWRLSLGMIAERPLAGVGYGRFEYAYNLRQAEYFGSSKGTETEKRNAAYVHMAYNEFLEHGVEGGLPGLLLFSGILCVLIWQGVACRRGPKANRPLHITCLAAVIMFALMSCMNFTVQAIPAMSLFVFYGSILSSDGPPVYWPRRGKALMGVLLLLAALWMIYTQTREATAQIQLRKAERIVNGAHSSRADAVLEKYGDIMRNKAAYWECLGKMAYLREDYQGAASFFSMGRRYSSEPAIFILSGNAYQMEEQYDSAEQQYFTAMDMEPSRILPRYALMNMYLQKGDTARAVARAAEILALQPKVASSTAEQFRTAAAAVRKLGLH